jgi:3-oxosteroid 1-dehydrogenase
MGTAKRKIVILGAGASGLAAALTAVNLGAHPIILEKQEKVGGTAAISGGIVWAPMNRQMLSAGLADNRDDALAYFRSLDTGDLKSETLEAFIDHCAEALGFLEDNSRLRFELLQGYPDYYLDRPGAKAAGGRALDSGLYAYTDLGAWREKVAHNGAPYPLTVAETPLGGGTGAIAPEVMQDRLNRDVRGFGQSLVGYLLEACLAAGVEIRLGQQVASLEKAHGRVIGVRMGSGEVLAAEAVLLATGGFEWNRDLAQTFLRGPLETPASPPGNQGDGLKLAMAAGASLGNMTSSWWCPTLHAEGETWPDGSPRAYPVLIERTLPGSLMVNRAGQRFCNEAGNYSAMAGAFHVFDPARYGYVNLPAWLIFDHGYKLRSMVASAMPGPDVPIWMHRAESLEALAQNIGVDPDGLCATVTRFNDFAITGYDADFKRGESPYDHFYGDRSQPGTRATLGPLAQPPFYAVRLQIGTLGTNGGAKTDGKGRVLDHDGAIIPGLYAAGNCMACPTGGVYAGAGGTLGPALTFGYLAGRDAALGGN